MSITIERIKGITVHIVWTCNQCGEPHRLSITIGVPQTITCKACGHRDTVNLEEQDGGIVG
jgi:RNase P subunit RPR2